MQLCRRGEAGGAGHRPHQRPCGAAHMRPLTQRPFEAGARLSGCRGALETQTHCERAVGASPPTHTRSNSHIEFNCLTDQTPAALLHGALLLIVHCKNAILKGGEDLGSHPVAAFKPLGASRHSAPPKILTLYLFKR